MRNYDAIVIGAGPAGCGAARLLASWGHRTLVVDRPSNDERSLAESIPPSAQRPLAAMGMLTAIEDARFVPWRGNLIWWGTESPRTETFPAGAAGYQVVRRDFDRVLRRLAAEAGAEILEGLARTVDLPTSPSGRLEPAPTSNKGQAILTLESQSRVESISASFVLDCSGRTGVIARKALRRIDPDRKTIALTGVWRVDARWPLGDPTQTLVASYRDGWAWSVTTAPDARQITMMVDPARSGLARGVPARDIYLAELSKVGPFRALVAPATLADGPWGADASSYDAHAYGGPGFLLAGDAASFIDPLSSFGVKKALASGWLAAIVVHTSLVHPEMSGPARMFFEQRERAMHGAAVRQAAAFAASAAGDDERPFWLARAGTEIDLDAGGEVDVAALARDRDVLAAFEDLRQRPIVRFRTGPSLRIESRPAVRGREIVSDDHVVLADWPDGLRYLRGVDLVELTRLAPRHKDVGEMYTAMTEVQPSIALPDFLGALAVLVARGALEHVRQT